MAGRSDMNGGDGVDRGLWFIFEFNFELTPFSSCAINSYEVVGVYTAIRLVRVSALTRTPSGTSVRNADTNENTNSAEKLDIKE